MANLSINNGGVSTNKGSMPNIDLRYGPYASVHAAHAALADDEVNTPGLTVGIVSDIGGQQPPHVQHGLDRPHHLRTG